MSFLSRVITEAKIQVYNHPIVTQPGGFCGGPVILDEEGGPLRHTRNGVPVDSFRENVAYPARLNGNYTYAGPIYGHFGHFISEMVHRILPSRSLGWRHPFIFVTTNGDGSYPTYEHFPAFAKEILGFLGINGSQVQVISENTIVEKLHICEPGLDFFGKPKGPYLDMLSKYATSKLDALHGQTGRPKRLYVSRSGVAPAGIVLGERYLENLLEREGYVIFRPEENKYTPQIDHYRKADTIIFPEGSACHCAELLGSGMMNNTYMIPRRTPAEAKRFFKLIEIRSKNSEMAQGTVHLLGSALSHPESGSPLMHLGVSLIDVPRLADFFRKRGLAKLTNISVGDYVHVAEEDFGRYISLCKRGSLWNADLAERLESDFKEKIGSVAQSSS